MPKLISFVFILSLFWIDVASADSGKLDDDGCHFHKQWGSYHCHDEEDLRTTEQKNAASTTGNVVQNKLVRLTQKNLNILGYNVGTADGVMGNKTKEAIIQFQRENSMYITGKPSNTLLIQLKTRASYF